MASAPALGSEIPIAHSVILLDISLILWSHTKSMHSSANVRKILFPKRNKCRQPIKILASK